MEIMLDTNAYADWRRGIRWAEAVSKAERVHLPVIVLGELEHGFRKGRFYQENKEKLNRFLESDGAILTKIGEETAEIFGELALYLHRSGTPIPTNDIWIAALCIESQATLLTGDKHFEHLPQVRVQWANE